MFVLSLGWAICFYNKQISRVIIIHTPLELDTGYPHDGRADNATYRHDRRADKRHYPHDRDIDIQML